MKILVVSDQIVDSIYDTHIKERLDDVDMALSCGDLPYFYLEFIATMLNVSCFFVHGNHDRPESTADGRIIQQPGGWTNLDERTVKCKGLIIGGLEGSIRYRPRGEYQYTEFEMIRKVWRMTPALLLNRVLHGRYLDILITHSPPFGIHDGVDRAHRGFKVFLDFMARFRPRYLLHGHKHIYGRGSVQRTYLDTKVINVYPSRIIEW